MTSGDKKNKEIRKKLQNYLKKPSAELEARLKESGFTAALSELWPKLSTSKRKNAIELLRRDASEEALQLLGRIALDPAESIEVRLNSSEILEEKGAMKAEESPGPVLKELRRAADEDNGQLAARIAPGLSEKELEAFADLMVEKEAVNALTASGKGAADRNSEKILRRAAHRLRSRGTEVPDWEEKGESVLRPAPKEEPLALATIPDGEGKQAIFIYLPLESGFVHVGQAIMDEGKGIEEYQGAESARSNARALLKRIRSEERIKLFEMPLEHAAWLLESAAELTSRNNVSTSQDYAKIKTFLAEAADSYQPPEPDSLIEGEVGPKDALESAGLLERYTMQSWAPDDDSMKLCRSKLDAALTSSLVITESQRREQVEKAFHDSARAYLESEAGRNFAGRLKEAARLLAWNNETDSTRQAIAAARELESADMPPHLVVEMFRKVFPGTEEAIKQTQSSGGGAGPSETSQQGSEGGGIIMP